MASSHLKSWESKWDRSDDLCHDDLLGTPVELLIVSLELLSAWLKCHNQLVRPAHRFRDRAAPSLGCPQASCIS